MSESAPVPPISEIAEDLAWRAHDARELGIVAAEELAAANAEAETLSANAETNARDAETLEATEAVEELRKDYAALVEEFNQSSAMAACIFGPEWGRYRQLALGPNHQPDYEAYGDAYGVSDQLAVQLNLPMVELVDIYNQGDVNPLVLAQIKHGLTRQGLHTLADVLVIGTEYGTGAGSLPGFNMIRRTVERIDPEFDWQPRPSVAHIAKICRTPLEVPGRVLGKVFGKLHIGDLTQNRPLQDFLDLSGEDLIQLITRSNPDASAEAVEKSAQVLQKKTNAFTRDFLAERSKLLRKLAQE